MHRQRMAAGGYLQESIRHVYMGAQKWEGSSRSYVASSSNAGKVWEANTQSHKNVSVLGDLDGCGSEWLLLWQEAYG